MEIKIEDITKKEFVEQYAADVVDRADSDDWESRLEEQIAGIKTFFRITGKQKPAYLTLDIVEDIIEEIKSQTEYNWD